MGAPVYRSASCLNAAYPGRAKLNVIAVVAVGVFVLVIKRMA